MQTEISPATATVHRMWRDCLRCLWPSLHGPWTNLLVVPVFSTPACIKSNFTFWCINPPCCYILKHFFFKLPSQSIHFICSCTLQQNLMFWGKSTTNSQESQIILFPNASYCMMRCLWNPSCDPSFYLAAWLAKRPETKQEQASVRTATALNYSDIASKEELGQVGCKAACICTATLGELKLQLV